LFSSVVKTTSSKHISDAVGVMEDDTVGDVAGVVTGDGRPSVGRPGDERADVTAPGTDMPGELVRTAVSVGDAEVTGIDAGLVDGTVAEVTAGGPEVGGEIVEVMPTVRWKHEHALLTLGAANELT
jgi:hypothetical protein